MEFEVLQKEIFQYLSEGQSAKAEQRLHETKAEFSGRSLGRWHRLFAQVVRRSRPGDWDAVHRACSEASKLLQGEQADLCEVYLLQMATAISTGDWRTARTFIRRLRAMFRRHPNYYEVQRLQGGVLANEGLIERATGNYQRAIDCLTAGVELMERYLDPADERARKRVAIAAHISIADSYLHLGEHGKAVAYLSNIEPESVPEFERSRYCYVQSRYWLAVGSIERAAHWFSQIGQIQDWDPNWPAYLLELEADIALTRKEFSLARDLLRQALEKASRTINEPFLSHLQQKIESSERM